MAPGRKRNGGPSEAAEIKKAAKEAGPSSLFIFSEKNRLRELCRFTIVWLHFEHTIFMTVVASCIVQLLHVFEKNLPQHNKTILVQKLEATEIYFLAIFCVEAAIKIIALGFVLHRGSYLRDVWNAIDFFVLVTGFITAFPRVFNLYIDMRMLRAIRCVLRLITVQTNLRYIEIGWPRPRNPYDSLPEEVIPADWDTVKLAARTGYANGLSNVNKTTRRPTPQLTKLLHQNTRDIEYGLR